ncbi:MAG TPA: inositol 2-dehydrogenase [Candidatus Stercoripulliclostridium merdipullorum]|uniref:Inositol 2-dehydrogenase n=1 Tax=Candidatus Stercoripulliclostridium merdipullorum TaxID=2840952 RepID=A0A9D1NC46_9FIRM|nr:inositol 2-dehydrogenase [Candidatus Stercoripulliclostridium merdipullorum]
MIQIGIIGAGRIGKVHAESITRFVKGAEVKAIADPYLTEETKAWANAMGIAEAYGDYHKILADPAIDIVLICSSTDTHSQISLEAIAAGKHVFCEKPIDHDVEKIKAVIAALKDSKVKYQVGFNRRFDHNFMAAREAVKSGKIGDLNILKITSRDPGAPPVSYIKVSGGIFLDMTIHDFDMVRFMSGAEVEEVYAIGGVLVDPAIGEAGDIDTAIITMKLSNGALAVIDNCRRATYGYDQRVEAFGSLGQVAIGNDTDSTAVISNGEGVTAEKPKLFFLERYMQAYVAEVSAFIDAVVNDKEVAVSAEDGLKPVLIGLAAKKSLAENRPVKISEIG